MTERPLAEEEGLLAEAASKAGRGLTLVSQVLASNPNSDTGWLGDLRQVASPLQAL